MIHTRKVLRLKRQKLGLINKRKVNTSSSEMSVKRLNFLETKILFMKICNDNKPIIPFLLLKQLKLLLKPFALIDYNL